MPEPLGAAPPCAGQLTGQVSGHDVSVKLMSIILGEATSSLHFSTTQGGSRLSAPICGADVKAMAPASAKQR